MKTVELHEDLLPYLELGKPFDMLRHPLYYSVPYLKGMNDMINEQYVARKKYVAKLLVEKKYYEFIFMHEKPCRLDSFLSVCKLLQPSDYWDILRDIWTNSENIWQNKDVWARLLNAKIPDRHLFMESDDAEYLAKLPNQIIVYRGCIEGRNEDGMSWTIKKEIATRMSKRYFAKNGIVITKVINKTEVFAYLSSRNEHEIILL
jgi:hypothetical protein